MLFYFPVKSKIDLQAQFFYQFSIFDYLDQLNLILINLYF